MALDAAELMVGRAAGYEVAVVCALALLFGHPLVVESLAPLGLAAILLLCGWDRPRVRSGHRVTAGQLTGSRQGAAAWGRQTGAQH